MLQAGPFAINVVHISSLIICGWVYTYNHLQAYSVENIFIFFLPHSLWGTNLSHDWVHTRQQERQETVSFQNGLCHIPSTQRRRGRGRRNKALFTFLECYAFHACVAYWYKLMSTTRAYILLFFALGSPYFFLFSSPQNCRRSLTRDSREAPR